MPVSSLPCSSSGLVALPRWSFSMGNQSWLVALVMVVGSLSTRGSNASDDDAFAADDGWRRTAEGWVHVDQMRTEAYGIPPRQPDRFIFDELTRPVAARWDFHPAVLAIGQIMVAAAAFAGVRSQAAALRNSGRESSLHGQSQQRKAA
jgi:hypothetical protein